ncbi:hypothetical protein EJB05_49904, partial [Eragrostis curvula]
MTSLIAEAAAAEPVKAPAPSRVDVAAGEMTAPEVASRSRARVALRSPEVAPRSLAAVECCGGDAESGGEEDAGARAGDTRVLTAANSPNGIQVAVASCLEVVVAGSLMLLWSSPSDLWGSPAAVVASAGGRCPPPDGRRGTSRTGSQQRRKHERPLPVARGAGLVALSMVVRHVPAWELHGTQAPASFPSSDSGRPLPLPAGSWVGPSSRQIVDPPPLLSDSNC